MWGARLVLPVTWMSTTDHFSSPSPVTNAELPAPHSMLLHGTRIATYTVSFVGKTYTLFEVRSIRVDDMCSLFLDKSSNFSLSFRAQLGVTRHPTYRRSGIARPIFLGRFFFFSWQAAGHPTLLRLCLADLYVFVSWNQMCVLCEGFLFLVYLFCLFW